MAKERFKNLKFIKDQETGEDRISLPVHDFEQMVEQILDLPEALKGLREMQQGNSEPWDDVIKELRGDGLLQD